MKPKIKLAIAVALAAVLLSMVATAHSAEICFNPTTGAGGYWLGLNHSGQPNAALKTTLETTTVDTAGVIHYQLSEPGLWPEVGVAPWTVTLSAYGSTGVTSWHGDAVTITDFACTSPVDLPGFLAVGDFNCDGRETAIDSLAHLLYTTGSRSPLRICP